MAPKKKPWKRTGLSRTILLALERGPATADDVLERLGPMEKVITRGAVWVILERAMRNGLVRSDRRDEGTKKPYRYELTDGGRRRVAWIKGKLKLKLKPVELRVAANPAEVEEE